jgi:hypothetical protein
MGVNLRGVMISRRVGVVVFTYQIVCKRKGGDNTLLLSLLETKKEKKLNTRGGGSFGYKILTKKEGSRYFVVIVEDLKTT